MSANHYPLRGPLYLSLIGTLIGIHDGCLNAQVGDQHKASRHELYKLQLIEKKANDRPEITDKGVAYLTKLRAAASTITLTPVLHRVEWV